MALDLKPYQEDSISMSVRGVQSFGLLIFQGQVRGLWQGPEPCQSPFV